MLTQRLMMKMLLSQKEEPSEALQKLLEDSKEKRAEIGKRILDRCRSFQNGGEKNGDN